MSQLFNCRKGTWLCSSNQLTEPWEIWVHFSAPTQISCNSELQPQLLLSVLDTVKQRWLQLPTWKGQHRSEVKLSIPQVPCSTSGDILLSWFTMCSPVHVAELLEALLVEIGPIKFSHVWNVPFLGEIAAYC